MKRGHARRCLFTAAIVAALGGGTAVAADVVPMVLATTPKYTDEIRAVDGSLVTGRPGHHAELMQEASKHCGASVSFRFLPWQRALAEVKNGGVDGAFSASYDPERAIYGAYPLLTDGKPDSSRALKGYSYSLYVRRDSTLAWDGRNVAGAGLPVAVERGASVIPRMRELGLTPVEISDNTVMLRMVAGGGRVAAAALMTPAADAILDNAPDLRAAVVKLEPTLEDKFGYVMLSRPFHDRHPQLAECFWTLLRDLRRTPEHAERVKSYQAETPVSQGPEIRQAPARLSEQGPAGNPS